MSASNAPRQLRLIIKAPDFDEAVLRIALEVDDTRGALREAREAGMRPLSEPVETPFRSSSNSSSVKRGRWRRSGAARGLPAATTKGRSRSSTTVAQ